MKLEVKNLKGKKVGDITLSKEVFGVEVNEALLHEVYVAYNANQRQSTAHTKTIGDRAGSTRKPWKQKGTGRARTGSVRNPIWRKGGVTFGPSNEKNYEQKINKKVAKKAFCMALSGKLASSQIIIVDELKLENNKTKDFAAALEALEVKRKAIIAFAEGEKDTARASRNIESVKNTEISKLNVVDILNNPLLIVSQEGIKGIEERCLGKQEEKVVEKKAAPKKAATKKVEEKEEKKK